MQLYRVAWAEYAKDITGHGAWLYGGRWNRKETACIYCSESRALAVLEFAVNVTIETMPPKLSLITLSIPETDHLVCTEAELPEKWKAPQVSKATQNFGSSILQKAGRLIIKIPSVVIPDEYNYIINPLHPAMKKVSVSRIADFSFDIRLKS